MALELFSVQSLTHHHESLSYWNTSVFNQSQVRTEQKSLPLFIVTIHLHKTAPSKPSSLINLRTMHSVTLSF